MHNEAAQLRYPVHTKNSKAYPLRTILALVFNIMIWHVTYGMHIRSNQWPLHHYGVCKAIDQILCLFHLLGVALLDLL